MKNNIRFLSVLIALSLLFSGCTPSEPSESVPEESLTETELDVGTDDSLLLEYFESLSDGKAYFSAASKDRNTYNAPIILTAASESAEHLCDHSECDVPDAMNPNIINCKNRYAGGTVIGNYAYSVGITFEKWGDESTYKYKFYSTHLSDDKSGLAKQIDEMDIDIPYLDYVYRFCGNDLFFIPRPPSDNFPVRPTIAYRLDLSLYIGGEPAFVEYEGLTGSFNPLYTESDGRVYCVKTSDEEMLHYTGLYVFDPESKEPCALLENMDMLYKVQMYPGLGDSIVLYTLELSTECKKGYELWQYTIVESDGTVKYKKTLRAREVLDFAVAGDSIYALMNLESGPKVLNSGNYTFYDYTGSRVYEAPLFDGEFKSVWRDTDCVIYGYTMFNIASKKSAGGASVPIYNYAITETLFDGFVISSMKYTDKRLAHTYILFDVSGDDIAVRYVKGNDSSGISVKTSYSNGMSYFGW